MIADCTSLSDRKFLFINLILDRYHRLSSKTSTAAETKITHATPGHSAASFTSVTYGRQTGEHKSGRHDTHSV